MGVSGPGWTAPECLLMTPSRHSRCKELRAIGGEQANVVPRDRQVAEELRLGADVDSVAAAAARRC